MGTTIIKVDRETDLYVEWSSVVDAPTAWGDRAWMAEHLLYDEIGPPVRDVCDDDERREEWDRRVAYETEKVERRMARADARGSSAMWPSTATPYAGWDYDELLVMTGPGAPGLLPRSSLAAYVNAEDETVAAALCRPVEDD